MEAGGGGLGEVVRYRSSHYDAGWEFYHGVPGWYGGVLPTGETTTAATCGRP